MPMSKTILAIETSCDETSIALIKATPKDGGMMNIDTIAHIVHSQANLHTQYGGVFPALARREHSKNLVPVMLDVISHGQDADTPLFAQTTPPSVQTQEHVRTLLAREPKLHECIVRHLYTISGEGIDSIAVTQGPGLEPALWVGINFAQALGTLWNIPVTPINHMAGHLISALYDEKRTCIITPPFPLLTLLISGGHTELVLSQSLWEHTIIGKTRDDAVGEAYDKVARLLGLPYPGGPEVARLADEARTRNIQKFSLPRPMIDAPNLDFSFSGLKTAVLYLIRDIGTLDDIDRLALAREFEDAVTDVLTRKFIRALETHNARTCSIGGGVAANTHIREALRTSIEHVDSHISLRVPPKALATDNAFMIACADAVMATHNITQSANEHLPLKADGNLSLS